MKATGRQVDPLGRIVFPKELRDIMEIKTNTPLAVFIDDQKIVLKKYEPDCMFCCSFQELYFYKGKNICKACIAELKEIAQEGLCIE